MSITRSIRSSLFALVLLAMSAAAYAQFSISVIIRSAGIAGLRATAASPARATSGHLATGLTPAMTTVTTGCRAHG